MVSAITATNPAIDQSGADKARTQLGGDFQTFMKLLTTQLKNQDPIEPLDTNEFTAQLVQFANVEQNIDTNKNLEELISMQQGSQVNNAVNYIGKFVQAEGNSGRLQNGVASFAYELPSLATTAEVTVTDETGNVVFNGPGTTNVGQNDVLWDGSNSYTGQTMKDGTYKIAVVAKDADGNKIEAKTFTTGFVTSVNLADGVTKLGIGKIELTLDKILAVRDASSFLEDNGTETETETE